MDQWTDEPTIEVEAVVRKRARKRNRALAWLRRLASQDYQPPLARAYAFYVLAREGQANLSDLRYFSDTKMAAMTSGLAPALTGAAAALSAARVRQAEYEAEAERLGEALCAEKPKALTRLVGAQWAEWAR